MDEECGVSLSRRTAEDIFTRWVSEPVMPKMSKLDALAVGPLWRRLLCRRRMPPASPAILGMFLGSSVENSDTSPSKDAPLGTGQGWSEHFGP